MSDTTTTTLQAGDLVVVVPGGDHPSTYSLSPYYGIPQEERVWVYTGNKSVTGSDRELILTGYHTDEGNNTTSLSAGWEIEGNPSQVEPWIVDVFGKFGAWFVGPDDLALATDEQVAKADPILVAKAALIARRYATEEALATPSAGEEALAQFKALVAASVTKEAVKRGWCSEVDEWLATIGLERTKVTRKVTVTIPSFELEVETWDGEEVGDGRLRDLALGALGIPDDGTRHSPEAEITIGTMDVTFDDPGCSWSFSIE